MAKTKMFYVISAVKLNETVSSHTCTSTRKLYLRCKVLEPIRQSVISEIEVYVLNDTIDHFMIILLPCSYSSFWMRVKCMKNNTEFWLLINYQILNIRVADYVIFHITPG